MISAATQTLWSHWDIQAWSSELQCERFKTDFLKATSYKEAKLQVVLSLVPVAQVPDKQV